MNIGVIGIGVVGNAVVQGFNRHFDVLTYDKEKPCTHASIAALVDAVDGPIFVCVPTPSLYSGASDTRAVEDVVAEIAAVGKAASVAIKSTVPPGTTERLSVAWPHLNICFNPEFLTEANAEEDFQNQDYIIIGSYRAFPYPLQACYKKTFPKAQIYDTGCTEAELAKYTVNCFLALKVAFANEMYDLCSTLGVEWEKVEIGAIMDDRVGLTHLSVPGPDGKRGFGGSCFPKDTRAILHEAEKAGVSLSILKAALESNARIRQEP